MLRYFRLALLSATAATALVNLAPVRRHDFQLQARPSRFTQTAHHTTATKNNNANTKKPSIEDLEQRLSSRYGTDLKRWTAQDFDDDDDDDEYTTTQQQQQTMAKPVLDPFGDNVKPSKIDPMLRRVQQSQEKLRTAAKENLAKENKVKQPVMDKDTTTAMTDSPVQSSVQRTEENLEEELIADNHDEFVPTNGGSLVESGGFFFGNNKVVSKQQQPEAVAAETTIETPVKREKRQAALPLLDEDGNGVLLTPDQAEQDFFDTTDDIDQENDDSDEDSKKSWQDLGITNSVLLENLQAMDCVTPLPVQVKACPSITKDKLDVIVGTYTGSGKTLAFMTPLIQNMMDNSVLDTKSVQIIVIAPGRELASQIVSVTRDLLQNTGFTVQLAIGGTTFTRNLEQIRKRKPQIIVGTPGRLAELIVGRPGDKSGRLKISGLQSLVLDEFDALLEYKAHRDPTNAILELLYQRRGDDLQSVFCSATACDVISKNKLDKYLRPGYVQAMTDQHDVLVTNAQSSSVRVSRTVMHGVVHVEHRRFALETLRKVLHTEPVPRQVLIFVDNSRKAQILVEKLENMGIIAAPLHGGANSEKIDRAEVSKALREGYVGIVVATEMAARGLDAPLLTHVVNYDLPTDASHYAHRAGRCGRGGRPGVVINITTDPKERNVPKKLTDQLGVELHTVEARSGQLILVDPKTVDID